MNEPARGTAVSLAPRRPPGDLLTGNLAEFRRDPIAFLSRCAREYGDVVFLRFGPTRTIAVSNAELVEEVLVTRHEDFGKQRATIRGLSPMVGNGLFSSDGDFWLRQRRMMQPAFHRQRVASYGAEMVEAAQRMLSRWHDGDERDVHHEMTQLTLAIVAKTLFNADISGEASSIGRTVTQALESTNNRMNSLIASTIPYAVPTPGNLRLRRAVRRLNDLIYRIIAERRASGEDPGDLLSVLLLAHDQDDGAGMTDRQLRDELMTLLGAGHETTAVALSWAWYLLAQHPNVEKKLHTELEDVLGDRAPNADDFPRLRYTQMIVQETLRLYPPVWVIGREARRETALGGYPVSAGTALLLSSWVVQRDPRYFERPEEFDPDRWADGLVDRLPKYAYFPFGAGQRMCIGAGFATMEATLIIAAVAQRYRFALLPEPPVELKVAITLRPKHGIPMTLHRR